jgi:hypothetical protein
MHYSFFVIMKFSRELIHIKIEGSAKFQTQNPLGGQATVAAVSLEGIYD